MYRISQRIGIVVRIGIQDEFESTKVFGEILISQKTASTTTRIATRYIGY